MERLGNAVIQASKRIKNETEISTGATSVSFCRRAIHYGKSAVCERKKYSAFWYWKNWP